MRRALVGLVLCLVPALAWGQASLLQGGPWTPRRMVCAMAMRNAALPTETTYGVSVWCVNMNAKIVQALQMPPAKSEEGK